MIRFNVRVKENSPDMDSVVDKVVSVVVVTDGATAKITKQAKIKIKIEYTFNQ